MKKYLLVGLLSALVTFSVTTFASGIITFEDVDYDAYYADSVTKMAGMGVVTGYEGSNDFGVGDYITREDVAVMLDRYDNALLIDADNTAQMVSGVFELQTLICSGAIDFEGVSDHTYEIYEELCLTDGEF
ncbi:MAG: S-layer homology domain-containing protein [Candidatus Gracilibacteria bacterium]